MTLRIAGCLFVVSLLVSPGDSAEPVYFRHNHGIAAVEATPSHFDQSNLLWRVAVPRGHSTPVLVGEALFMTAYDKQTKDHLTIAIDRTTGQEIWKKSVDTDRVEQQHQFGSPAAASVASDGERVYGFFGSFGLLCYSLDGELQWSNPMGPFQDEFGSSSSPILARGKLILNEDHDADNFLTAIDCLTGETIWRVPRDEFTRSYSTPTIWEHDDRQEIIVAGSTQLTAYDLETGAKLWWVDGLARIVNTTPVVQGDTIYVASWSPGGDVGERIAMEDWKTAVARFDRNSDSKIRRDELQPGDVLTRFYRIDLDQDGGLSQREWERHASVFDRAENTTLALRAGGEGDVTRSAVIWKNSVGAPYVASPLVHDGVVWLAKDGGIFTSLDAATGRVIKRGRLPGRGNYYASPVLGKGRILVASQHGVLSVLSAQGDWEVLASHDFGEGLFSTPVLADDRLYIRTEVALYCYLSE